jgi:hypothetical protein
VGATISTRLLRGRLLSRVSEVRSELEGGSDGT